jgi:DUF4097 and DUF4098 domain-containing protein YvlB
MKAGKYTAALLLLGVGTALIADMITGGNVTGALIKWWPVVLIALGVEYMIVSVANRNNGKSIGIAFGSLFLASGICIAAIAVTNAANLAFLRNLDIHLGNITIGNVSYADENGRRFEMDPVRASVADNEGTIYLNNLVGDVTIRTGDVKEMELKGTVYVHQSVDNGEEIARKSEIRVEHKGDRLEITADGPEYRVRGIKQKPRINLAVTVPHDLDQSWHISVTNGDVDVSGITVRGRLLATTLNGLVELADITGDVAGETANGAIVIRNIRGNASADTTNGRITIASVDGNASADTAQGRVELRDIGGDVSVSTMNGNVAMERIGGNVKTETANGSIQLTEAGGAVNATSVNGNITVRTARLAGDFDLDSLNGKITVHLPEDASFEVDGETTHGDIVTDFPLDAGKREIRGKVNGGTYEIDIDTNDDIAIRVY